MSLHILSDASALFLLWLFAQAGTHKLSLHNFNYYAELITEYLNLNSGIHKQDHAKKLELLIKTSGCIEIVLAIALVIPASRAIAAPLCIAILTGYFILMAYQLYLGKRDMDCGCGGPAGQLKISPLLLARNLIYILFTSLCLVSGLASFSALSVIAIAIAFTTILLNLIIEQLIVNQQKLKLLRN